MHTKLYAYSVYSHMLCKRFHALDIGNKKSLLFREGLESIVVLSGLEPPTHGFSVRCSTN